MTTVAQLLNRPRPPEDLIAIDGSDGRFIPAPEIEEWIRDAYLDESGALYYHGHSHLENATIGCLWTSAECKRRGKRVVGMAEMPPQATPSLWQKARTAQQLRLWFGQIPNFLLTFDAFFADQADDASFCALVDHELTHCAQAEDEFNQPRFSQTTGEPVWSLRGHDLEEFVSVVQRFGVGAAGQEAIDLVIAAGTKPLIAPAKLAQACGTCLKKAA